jgi:hypothetical protein
VIVVSGSVNVGVFVGEVVLPVVLEVTVGFEGA